MKRVINLLLTAAVLAGVLLTHAVAADPELCCRVLNVKGRVHFRDVQSGKTEVLQSNGARVLAAGAQIKCEKDGEIQLEYVGLKRKDRIFSIASALDWYTLPASRNLENTRIGNSSLAELYASLSKLLGIGGRPRSVCGGAPVGGIISPFCGASVTTTSLQVRWNPVNKAAFVNVSLHADGSPQPYQANAPVAYGSISNLLFQEFLQAQQKRAETVPINVNIELPDQQSPVKINLNLLSSRDEERFRREMKEADELTSFDAAVAKAHLYLQWNLYFEAYELYDELLRTAERNSDLRKRHAELTCVIYGPARFREAVGKLGPEEKVGLSCNERP